MKNFGGFNEINDEKKISTLIIPCPYEETTTYGQGTANGPEAILEASQELEFWDDELELDPSELGIKTREPVKLALQDANTEKPFAELEQACTKAYEAGQFPLVLGGEHSLSLGAVRAAYNKVRAEGRDLTLLHFDAHADLRSEYEGNPYNHACAIYSIFKACPRIKIVSVGIRNISKGECDWLKSMEKQVNDHILEEMPITIFYARDEYHKTFGYRSANKEFKDDLGAQISSKKLSLAANHKYWNSKDVLDTLKGYHNNDVYITFDLDGFDSGIMPSTGTPEPGGLDWYTATNIIRETSHSFNIVGADVVELAPRQHNHAPDFLAAKLCYKIIAAANL